MNQKIRIGPFMMAVLLIPTAPCNAQISAWTNFTLTCTGSQSGYRMRGAPSANIGSAHAAVTLPWAQVYTVHIPGAGAPVGAHAYYCTPHCDSRYYVTSTASGYIMGVMGASHATLPMTYTSSSGAATAHIVMEVNPTAHFVQVITGNCTKTMQ